MRSTAKERLSKQKNDVIIYLRIPKKMHVLITKISEKEDKTISSVVRQALVQAYQ